MDRLKALEVLRAIVDHAGFSRAAETMQMSTSTATRLIQELEDEMGVRLLNRTTRKIALTSVGECVYQRATSLLSSYDELSFLCKESTSDPRGTVRLEVPAVFGNERLGQVLASFVANNPKINVELHVADGSGEILSDRADAAISVGRSIPSAMVARPLSGLRMGLYASRRYLQQTGMPTHPRELAQDNLMALGTEVLEQPLLLVEDLTGKNFPISTTASLRANHADALISAAVHGAGVALVPCAAVEVAEQQGLLVPVLSNWWPTPIDVHLVYRSPRFQPVRVRTLIEHLLASMSRLEVRHRAVPCDQFKSAKSPALTAPRVGQQLEMA